MLLLILNSTTFYPNKFGSFHYLIPHIYNQETHQKSLGRRKYWIEDKHRNLTIVIYLAVRLGLCNPDALNSMNKHPKLQDSLILSTIISDKLVYILTIIKYTTRGVSLHNEASLFPM